MSSRLVDRIDRVRFTDHARDDKLPELPLTTARISRELTGGGCQWYRDVSADSPHYDAVFRVDEVDRPCAAHVLVRDGEPGKEALVITVFTVGSLSRRYGSDRFEVVANGR